MLDARIQNQLQQAKILIVDDEELNVRLLHQALTTAAYKNIDTTTDSRQVINLCHKKAYDLILLDLNMPHKNGMEVLDELKNNLDKVPAVLMITAQTAIEYRQKALTNGARDYITKPFDIVELLARVKNQVEVEIYHKSLSGENSYLESLVNEKTRRLLNAQKELKETSLFIIRCLGRAAEYRDNETGMHIIRMSRISALLGKAAGLSDTEVELILHASAMHDLGKIGIPDKILLKEGPLDPKERKIMDTHASIGAEILEGSQAPLVVMAREIALTHHEKWDGSGYPNQLKGESIPLSGRLTALADVFDALLSVRPYKKAWPLDKVMNYITTQAGKHFDPTLVGLLEDNLDAALQIREEHSDDEAEEKRSENQL